MSLTLNILILLTACTLIFKSTDWFVRGTVDLAAVFRLPKIFIGIVLVSFVTTAPEFIVSTTASYLDVSGMAVGNALGSCLCNIGLAFSLGILIQEVTIHKKDYNYKLFFLIISLALVYLFISNGVLSRLEGLCLLIFFIIFLITNYRLALQGREAIPEIIEIDKKRDRLRKGLFFFLLGGMATILLARYGLVQTGIQIASLLGIPPIIIGLSVIAIGTSLPEVFTAIVSSRKNHGDIALGNVVGANIFNLLLVLGASALIRPLTIDTQTLVFNMPMVIGITALMLLLGLKDFKYSKKEGFLLLSFYLLYFVILFIFVY